MSAFIEIDDVSIGVKILLQLLSINIVFQLTQFLLSLHFHFYPSRDSYLSCCIVLFYASERVLCWWLMTGDVDNTASVVKSDNAIVLYYWSNMQRVATVLLLAVTLFYVAIVVTQLPKTGQ